MASSSLRLLIASFFVLAACSSKDGPPPLPDAGSDAGSDASVTPDTGPDDAGVDTAPVDAGPDTFDAGPLEGDSYVFVVDMLDVGDLDPLDETIAPGFNLDDRVSDRSDLETCNKEDYTSIPPDEDEVGVDNVLGPILAASEETFMIRAALRNNVRSGLILILMEVRGVTDLLNDDRIAVDVIFGLLPEGVTMPMLAAEGFVPGQTFDLDSRSLLDDATTARVSLPGQIVDGRVTAGPGGLNLTIPFGADTVSLQLNRVEARFDISEDAMAFGVIGGALDVEDTAVALTGVGGFDEALIRLVLGGNADLDKVGGTCTSASIGLVFRGVPAVKGSVVDIITP